jgi:Ser/Thr protein kinase RdoA (MazF antagonist)
MFDITTPLQGLLFDIGGMYRPCDDPSVLERFKTSFLNGYEQENHIDSFWLNEFDTFVQYRRILLFTVLQDYLDTNPPLKDAFKAMIASKKI